MKVWQKILVGVVLILCLPIGLAAVVVSLISRRRYYRVQHMNIVGGREV